MADDTDSTSTLSMEDDKETFIEERLESLQMAILNSRPPYCGGTLALKTEDLVIFYGKDTRESHDHVDFTNPSDEALEHLSNTCEKATFGLNQDDVLDESYRKAGKLDAAHFATKLDVERSGLMDSVRFNLLQGEASGRPIKAGLYKLNVYGKDSFFKSHKDTPRSTTMFGSLVIILPTVHEGGALILRHNDKEWIFDSAKEISESPDPKAHIGYTAFFSDVEHEVAPVKSGYRVTLTYNLYYDDDSDTPKALDPVKALPLNESDIKYALQELLEVRDFCPDGGYLGFGLNHEYPVEARSENANTLDFISEHLKGSDALLMKVCKDFKLDTRLYVFYRFDCDFELLAPKVLNLEDEGCYYDESVGQDLWKRHGAKLIDFVNTYSPYNQEAQLDFCVTWVSNKPGFNMQKTAYCVYGNEPSIEHAYGSFCLIARLGPPGNRATAE